jgi:hypothetical protein
MATLNIPTWQDGKAHRKFTILWEGVLYYVYEHYNARDERWYLSIHDSSDTAIEGCVARKLVTNWKITNHVTVDDRPPGDIYSSSADHPDPGLLELGKRVGLYYVESDDA